MSQNNAAYQTKIYQVLFGLVVLCLGLHSIHKIAEGSVSTAKIACCGIVAIAAIIVLDRRYWLLLPILSTLGLSIPGLPFTGQELGQIAVFFTHFVRLGLHRDKSAIVDSRTWTILPVSLWILAIFCINPTGLAIFGNSTIGFRFYLQIVFGFLTFFALSSQRFDEFDCKLLFWTLLVCSIARLLYGVAIPRQDPDAVVEIGQSVERSTRYAFIGFITVYSFLFCRHRLSAIISSFPKILLMFFAAVFVIYSGKRQAFGRLVLIPWFASFLRAKDRLLTFFLSMLALFALFAAVCADGSLVSLPKSATRSLAILFPSKYSSSQDNGGINDLFRSEIRKHAREIIREHPFVGRKGFRMSFEETAWIHFGGGSTSNFEGHAYAGNWHSTWYAYAADFGIPGMMLYALFFFSAIKFACKSCKLFVEGTYAHAVALHFAIGLLCNLVFSYTSGHSAHSYSGLCNQFGMILAIAAGNVFGNRKQIIVGNPS